jgi:deazaflavin-dependent oxidoreductase (nitroreductase family)
MTGPDPRFATMNAAVVEDFRAHGGTVKSGPFAGRPVLLLTTKGAHSGESRLAPLVYSRDGDRIVVIASMGGASVHPGWYRNLCADPVVTVELGGETFEARATVADGDERERLYAQHAAMHPNFLTYQVQTSRRIPVVLLDRIG